MEQTPTPKSNNTLIIILILIIVILVLGVGGYFGWKYFLKDRLSTGASTTSPSPTKTLTTSPTVSPITTTPTATLTSSKSISGDYVITDTNTRVIETSELISMTPWQLKVARNEIYARHGRPFVHKDLQCYFATKSWYHGNPDYTENLLTAVENKNVATIKAYEEKINSPLLSQDTGC